MNRTEANQRSPLGSAFFVAVALAVTLLRPDMGHADAALAVGLPPDVAKQGIAIGYGSALVVLAILAIGGGPDPAALRSVAPLLGGEWRFHLGDDPRWAGADVDDSRWETVNLGAPASSHDGDVGLPNYVGGWMVHGHPGYQGDHTDYCIQIIKKVGSPRLNLLFDIYHVQIMEGDIITRIREQKDYIGIAYDNK